MKDRLMETVEIAGQVYDVVEEGYTMEYRLDRLRPTDGCVDRVGYYPTVTDAVWAAEQDALPGLSHAARQLVIHAGFMPLSKLEGGVLHELVTQGWKVTASPALARDLCHPHVWLDVERDRLYDLHNEREA
jgi:hypothetical protein